MSPHPTFVNSSRVDCTFTLPGHIEHGVGWCLLRHRRHCHINVVFHAQLYMGSLRCRVGPIWVRMIQIYCPSRYFCRYRYIRTNISATDPHTNIFILADILPITGILADVYILIWPILISSFPIPINLYQLTDTSVQPYSTDRHLWSSWTLSLLQQSGLVTLYQGVLIITLAVLPGCIELYMDGQPAHLHMGFLIRHHILSPMEISSPISMSADILGNLSRGGWMNYSESSRQSSAPPLPAERFEISARHLLSHLLNHLPRFLYQLRFLRLSNLCWNWTPKL